MADNLLAAVLATLRRVHGEDTVDQEVSLYDIANEISTTCKGMMIVIAELRGKGAFVPFVTGG